MDVLLLPDGLTPGRLVKVARTAKGWRQIDLASKATEALKAQGFHKLSVTVADIVWMEADRRSDPLRRDAILAVLGLSDA